MISDHLTRLTYLFPWGLVIALFFALIFAILGIMIFRRALKKGEEAPAPEKEHPLLEKGRLFFAKYGYFSSDPLSKSFSYALKLLHSFIGGNQFRYKLPWVVMVGASDSGKSSILKSLSLDLPIGRPSFEGENNEAPLCDWWFYDHGIVLDVDGKLVMDPTQATSDEAQWELLLNLLATHRPKRPLDGVVINIPASEIIGRESLSHDDIMIRADYLSEKLWQMQRIMGLRIPIYIVVTKCDLVPGFESFCKSIPTQSGHNLFGWSNDKALDSIYITDWIDEAFSSINASLYRAQQEIYADGPTIDGRDGVFLFPLALNQLKGGVRTYADHMFKPSGYHESFFLRGIYFVGDSHIDSSTAQPKKSRNSALRVSQRIIEKVTNIYFVNDLFEKKIFREIGLARPVSRILLGNTSSMRLAKMAVVLAAIIGTLGLLTANTHLQNAKINLAPALKQVEITLGKISAQGETSKDIRRVFFDDQARILLNTMTQISVNQLSSVFIPASWLSSLNNKISLVMALAYDQVILQSMGDQLDYKAQQLIDTNTFIATTQSSKGIDPLETQEFQQLYKYVYDVRALELAANEFIQLGVTSSLQDVADIIKYLFDFDMPADFYTHHLYYTDALEKTHKVFDFESYQDKASKKLRNLFDQFMNASFDPNQMIPGLGSLMSKLNEFSGARNYAEYDADVLRQVYTSLQLANTSIADPGLNWVDLDQFNPGPQYDVVISLIVGSNFFSNTVTSELLNEIDQNFIKFRRVLAGYKSSLINGGDLFKVENGLAISDPSPGAIGLQNNLALFFGEGFMAPAEDKSILTEIPTGSVLLWDTLRLQQAVNLINSYNDFINSRLLNLPKNLQPMLQKVARESLTKNLVQYIANAEVFSAEAYTETSSAPEDALLSQIQNYRASAHYLEQILFSLQANNANNAFSTLKNLLTTQNYNLLAKLDNILKEESPYAIKMNSFDWWGGTNLASLEAFGATNLTELKNYLDLQRGRIHYLSQEFAEPLVVILEQINKEGMPGNLPLMTKWAGIVDELKGYERKAPGNGLVELENYIMNPLNEVTLSTCHKYASGVDMLSLKNDFFVSILVDLQEKLNKQCVNLSGFVSVDNYSQLAQYFNANLAGKFPFTESVNGSNPDALPDDIRTFFQMMDAQSNKIKETLKQASNLGATGKKALTFIEQMEKVRTFFGGYLAPDSSIPNPSFTFDVTFRVNKQKEIRANEILNWQVSSDGSSFDIRSPSRKCEWNVGQPVKVTFQWASNSPLQPQATEGSPSFSAQGEYASFTYEGTWAFLRLLREHQANTCDLGSAGDDQSTILRFDIPLTNVISGAGKSNIEPLKATVFIQFETSPIAMPPAKKDKTAPAAATAKTPPDSKIRMGVPVGIPYFPYHAPKLDNAGS